MTGKGRCTDNAYIERLWRAFKYEGSYLYQWNTVEDLKSNIPKWVYWYNYNRPHQSLNYSTPAETLYKAYSSNNCNSFYLNFQDLNLILYIPGIIGKKLINKHILFPPHSTYFESKFNNGIISILIKD